MRPSACACRAAQKMCAQPLTSRPSAASVAPRRCSGQRSAHPGTASRAVSWQMLEAADHARLADDAAQGIVLLHLHLRLRLALAMLRLRGKVQPDLVQRCGIERLLRARRHKLLRCCLRLGLLPAGLLATLIALFIVVLLHLRQAVLLTPGCSLRKVRLHLVVLAQVAGVDDVKATGLQEEPTCRRAFRQQGHLGHGARVALAALQADHFHDPTGLELGDDISIVIGLGEEETLLQHAVLAHRQPEMAAAAACAALVALHRADESADDAPLLFPMATADGDHVRCEQVTALEEHLVLGSHPCDPADKPDIRGDLHAKARQLVILFVIPDLQHQHLLARGEV
mmetsp:Transcript_116798/g.337454  ORF Transcript_116798/g.337454 Transcript_116798/m.337454 type:complete len:341 (+) Transcript_116798:163-1185(+)